MNSILHRFFHSEFAFSQSNPVAWIKFAPAPQLYQTIHPHQSIGNDLFGLTTGADCIDCFKEAAQLDVLGCNFQIS